MKVPQLDLRAQFAEIESDMRSHLEEVLSSHQYINGPKVTEFESAIAEYLGTQNAIGVSSGTDALLVALMALDVQAGDLVLTTPYSFFATAGAIARLGATPVFVDIDEGSYNLSTDALTNWFEQNPTSIDRVKACILVHLYGQASNLFEIHEVCRKYGIALIEDAAQAIGAKAEFEREFCAVGTMGHLGCFSFFPSKNLGGIGDGGLVVSDDEHLATKVRRLRNHGSFPKYYHDLVGGNFRLDSIQAAALLAKLPYLDGWHVKRQEHAAVYDEAFGSISEIRTPQLSVPRNHHIYNQYVISVPERDALREHLSAKEISSEIYYPCPFHLQACFSYLGYVQGDFPVAEKAANCTLALPIFPELADESRSYVIEEVRNFYA